MTKIECKGKVGDTIWYLFKSAVCSSKVQHMTVHICQEEQYALNAKVGYKDNIKILYKTSHGEINEKNIYLSRQELGHQIIEGNL